MKILMLLRILESLVAILTGKHYYWSHRYVMSLRPQQDFLQLNDVPYHDPNDLTFWQVNFDSAIEVFYNDLIAQDFWRVDATGLIGLADGTVVQANVMLTPGPSTSKVLEGWELWYAVGHELL